MGARDLPPDDVRAAQLVQALFSEFMRPPAKLATSIETDRGIPFEFASRACRRLHRDDRMELVARFASGDADEADIRRVQAAVAAWLKESGKIPLERYLQLPTTPAKMSQMRRNLSLADAARQIDCKSIWDGCLKLSEELHTFISRGQWLSWRRRDTPPEEASRLRGALFYVAKFNDGDTLSAKQIWRAVGHIFAKKCP